MLVAGVDLGGTKLLATAVDTVAGEQRAEHVVPSPVDGDGLVAAVVEQVAALEADVGEPIRAVGAGVAGLVTDGGEVLISPNLPGLVRYPVRDRLAEQLARPVRVENDATSAAWAEFSVGAGRDAQDMVLVTLGTGIGTGLVIDGRLRRGAHGFAGESGHMVIDVHGPVHVTGKRGPWELFGSGNGLGRLGREAAAAGRLATVLDRVGSVEAITGEDVGVAAAAADPEALAVLDEYAFWVGVGCANLVHVLDPELIVVGGGVERIGEPLRSAIARALGDHVVGAEVRPPVPVVLATLGHRAGAIGAALLAAESLTRGPSDR